MFFELFILYAAASLLDAGSYLVTFPNSLIPGENLDIRVTVIRANGPVNVSVSLHDSQNNTAILSTSRAVLIGIPSALTIKVPQNLPLSQYKVSINGSGGLVFSNESNINYENNNLNIFLQTDKTRYSAGQEVRYRAILLHPNLLGYNGPVNVFIHDGNGNTVERIGHSKTHDGVISGKILLSREPAFGFWTINVIAAGRSSTKYVEVNDYVVQRFNVEIAAPNVIKTSQTSFTISVKARFTFNADVLGNCTIQVYDKNSIYDFVEYWKQVQGVVHFTVPMTDMTRTFAGFRGIKVRALVTDNATDLTIAAEEDLKFLLIKTKLYPSHSNYVHYYKCEYLRITNMPGRDTFVPGLTYHTQISIALDDLPIGTTGLIEVTPIVTTAEEKLCLFNNPPTKWLDKKNTTFKNFYIDFDITGHATLNFPVSVHTDRIVFKMYYDGVDREVIVHSVSSYPVNLLRLNVDKNRVSVGGNLTINAEATEIIDGLIVFEVFAREILLKTLSSGLVYTKRTHIDISITEDMVPQVYIEATYVTKSGNILSDHVTLRVDGSPCRNKVSVNYNTTLLKPRGGLRMDIKADPNSTVYIMMEDEKNAILGTENDIFYSEIVSMVTNANMMVNNSVVLSDVDMNMKTDYNQLLMFNTSLPNKCVHITTLPPGVVLYPTWQPGMVPPPSCRGASGLGFGSSRIPTPAPGRTFGPGIPTTNIAVKEFIRSRFPDTWLWEKYQVGPSGKVSINQTVPDAITSWITSVFATNRITGFGISDVKQKITVKKNLFLTLDLPSSVIFGEELLLQISVFNYMAHPQQVFLQVIISDDPTHPVPAATTVPPNEGRSTYVHVTPKHIGIMKISVYARTEFFSASVADTLEKELFVKHNGLQKTRNEQLLVDVSNTRKTATQTIFLDDHPDMIPGTKTVNIKITGDFLVPNTYGLQQLIKEPTNCGEQTIIDIVPNVLLMKYMNATGQLAKAVENNTLNRIRSGYQNELAFRRRDGSFSVWGARDSFGSTWLTAYVLKSFRQATAFVTIDDHVMYTGMNWLLSHQNNDGSFSEKLPVLYVDQEKNGTTIKLTAFTLISLLECKDVANVQASLITSALLKGKRYLETRLSSISDAYTLSIVCYALAKSGSTYGPSCLSKLDSSKHIDGHNVYWMDKSMHSVAPARDIETTAYALLTYIAFGRQADASPIVKWLVSQRNPTGGFYSTQDTVVALQALTEYSSKQTKRFTNYGLEFNIFGMGFVHSYNTSQNDYDTVHQVEVPSTLDNVIIQAMGNGIAVVDVIQSFYVSGFRNGTFISVSAELENESLNSLTVMTVIRWNGVSMSHMILMELEMPTGFVVDRDFFISQKQVRKHETSGRKVEVFLDGIVQNGQTTVKVKMDRADPVVKNQACHITVYDYYEPTQQAVTGYESDLLKRANICDVCPMCNFCKGVSSFSQIGIGK